MTFAIGRGYSEQKTAMLALLDSCQHLLRNRYFFFSSYSGKTRRSDKDRPLPLF